MALNMDLKLDTDDTYSLGSRSMTCPSLNTSFSDASSAYHPFTPTSGCSTPIRRSSSTHFDGSFSSYSDTPFDLTPPSSAVSTQFPYDFKPGTPQDMLFHALPSTPSKYSVMMDAGLDSHGLNGQLTPPQAIDFLPFSSFHNPFVSPGHHSLDGSDEVENQRLWSQMTGEAPIDFDDDIGPTDMSGLYHSSAVLCSNQGNSGFLASPYRPQSMASRRQLHISEAQQKGAALQNLQKESPRLRTRASTRPRRVAKQAARSSAIPMCGPVKNIPLRQYYCDQGCTGKAYSRQEHLKRHFLTAHNPEKPVIACKFCPKDKVKIFDRADNYRQHLELHAKPGRKGRVEYHPSASKELAILKAQIKRRTPSKARLARDSEQSD
ncbi:hypothetical protein VTK73DRAFT_2651 [Phialemonium thermophilum]|uniref:C2H2-type domain-containing protein n=1 Tax=Phialemonium thermophilum TaxID=223376 RepID=A0ABR3X3D5_9PEZI